MKDSLAPGLGFQKSEQITQNMAVSHLGEGSGVYSTPAMISFMERACLEGITPHLDENEQTVGTMVHVWHRKALKVGQQVTCDCRLLERDRRRLLFAVKVTNEGETIGEGTHERFVIDTKKFTK